MRVYVQIIDKFTGIYQTGMIDEKVKEGHEVENALGHFGVRYGDIDWITKESNYGFGTIKDTFKVAIYYDYEVSKLNS